MPLVKMLKFHASATEAPMFAGRIYNITRELKDRLDQDSKRSGSPAYESAKVVPGKTKVLQVELPEEKTAEELEEEANDTMAAGT